jgi:apolipoprotein N-acyltransferase
VKLPILAFSAGLVSACGFQPLGLWPLTLIAVAVLIELIERADGLRAAALIGWAFGVGNFVLGLNWIATAFTYQAKMPAWLGWIAVALLAFYLAVYPALAAVLAWRRGKGRPLVLALAFAPAWIASEWLRATMFTGFAWNPLGVVYLDTPLAGAAALIGTYGLSGLAILAPGMLWLLSRRRWRLAAGVAGILLALPLMASLLARPEQGPPDIALRIVQPNIGQEDKWRPGFESEMVGRLLRLSRPANDQPRLLLWPEAAITRPLESGLTERSRETAELRQDVGAMIGPRDLLLTGGITTRSADGMEVTSGTNSIFAMDRSGRVLGRYDKAHLVPYGEYLPMRPLLSAIGLSRLAPGDLDFDPGPGPRTLALPLAGKVGFQLCYEIVFSGQVVDRANRPDFIFNPSNDAWFGRWGPPQHLAQARLRALEEGLPVLRSTPTGISAVIDGKGRLLHSLPWRAAGVIDARLPRPQPPTLFSRLGNLLPLLFALLLAGAAIAVRRKAR